MVREKNMIAREKKDYVNYRILYNFSLLQFFFSKFVCDERRNEKKESNEIDRADDKRR